MIKSLIRSLVPDALIQNYRRSRADARSKKRALTRDAARTFSVDELAELIAGLGVAPGDVLMVHSALGKFNNVEGGAEGVIRAIRTLIGPSGTLLVPTFPFWLETINKSAPFDVRTSPSKMGILTELVRRHENAFRSLHPTHSIAALGPLAEDFTSDHHRSPYAFGPHSPFFKAAAAGGKALLLGTDLNSFTGFHIHEDLLGRVDWLPVYEAETRRFSMTDKDGRESIFEGYFHDLGSSSDRDVERLREPAERAGVARRIHTDYSQASVIDLAGFSRLCLDELSEGRSAYGPVAVPAAAKAAVLELKLALP